MKILFLLSFLTFLVPLYSVAYTQQDSVPGRREVSNNTRSTDTIVATLKAVRARAISEEAIKELKIARQALDHAQALQDTAWEKYKTLMGKPLESVAARELSIAHTKLVMQKLRFKEAEQKSLDALKDFSEALKKVQTLTGISGE